MLQKSSFHNLKKGKTVIVVQPWNFTKLMIFRFVDSGFGPAISFLQVYNMEFTTNGLNVAFVSYVIQEIFYGLSFKSGSRQAPWEISKRISYIFCQFLQSPDS